MIKPTPKWIKSEKTFVFVFNVGRGLSVFIRMPNNIGIIYDMGSSTETKPSKILEDNIMEYISSIKQLIVSHPHKDHYSDSTEMLSMLERTGKNVELVTLPNFVKRENYKARVNQDGNVEEVKNECLNESLLENMSEEDKKQYKDIYGERKPPLRAIYPDAECAKLNAELECAIFYVRPPEVEELHSSAQEYGNGTSICFYYRHNNHVLFLPGDITPAAMKELLIDSDKTEKRYSSIASKAPGYNPKKVQSARDKNAKNPNLLSLLTDASLSIINVAPHHGLESCYCEDFFDVVNPLVNIVSEKSGEDGKVDDRYTQKIKHGVFLKSGKHPIVQEQGGKRKRLTTRQDGHLLIVMGQDEAQPVFYHSSEVCDLFEVLDELA